MSLDELFGHDREQHKFAMVLSPDSTPPWFPFSEAAISHFSGNHDRSEAICRQILIRNPSYSAALHLSGVMFCIKQEKSRGADLITRAIVAKPRDISYRSNLYFNVLFELGRLDEAMITAKEAVVAFPDSSDSHCNLGIISDKLVSLEKTELSYLKSIILKPDNDVAFSNLGDSLRVSGNNSRAMECYDRASKINQMNEAYHNNLGLCLHELYQIDLAENCFYKALSIHPEYAPAHLNLGLIVLTQGKFCEGWRQYEWRYKTDAMKKYAPHFDVPQWQGEPGDGRTILIYAEQGFGDSLQFCRLAPLVAARGWHILLEVPASLSRLTRTLAGIDRVLAHGETRPAFDVHCPMLSLPLALSLDLSNIPVEFPYLHPAPEAVAQWRRQLALEYGSSRRIGIAWAGNPRLDQPGMSAIDRRRSISPELLTPLFECSDINFFSLQKNDPERKSPLPPFSKGEEEKMSKLRIPPLEKGGRGDFASVRFPLIDFMDQMNDFADTAALIANLDLVISVDTAVAHLAGALGKPVWLLNRFDSCWRWLCGRNDSPWYPSMQIFRQIEQGNWVEVIERVKQNLKKFSLSPENLGY